MGYPGGIEWMVRGPVGRLQNAGRNRDGKQHPAEAGLLWTWGSCGAAVPPLRLRGVRVERQSWSSSGIVARGCVQGDGWKGTREGDLRRPLPGRTEIVG